MRPLREFWESDSSFADAEMPLRAWYDRALHSNWTCFADLKATFGSADAVGNSRIVFNIHGNKYRLVAIVDYKFHGVLIRFVGTHNQYDKIDASKV